MNNEKKKKSEKVSSNFKEILPVGKVDKGNKAVRKEKDLPPKADTSTVKAKNPAKVREESEQPVHPIKKAPKD
mgnify:FL=1|jgi:hypothetical protein